MLPPPPQLDPVVTPDMLPGTFSPGLWGWLGIIFGILALGAIVFFFVTRQKRKVQPVETPEQEAKRLIRALMAEKPALREGATALSLILRSYLTGKSNDPALFETHQEFNRRASALTSLPFELQGTARELLQKMAHLKYSSVTPQDAEVLDALFAQSLDLIDKIERQTAAPSIPAENRKESTAA